MKKLIVAVVLASTAIWAHADDTGKTRNIEELLNLTDAPAMMESMYSQMEVMLQDMGEQMGVTDGEQPIFDEYYSKMMVLMRKELNWDKVKDPIKSIYGKHFTDTEIRDLIKFYKTDTGKKTLEKLPVIMQESMAISQQALAKVLPQIQAMSQQLEADIAQARAKVKPKTEE